MPLRSLARARQRGSTFGVVMGFLAGALAVGLAVPYVRTAEVATAGPTAQRQAVAGATGTAGSTGEAAVEGIAGEAGTATPGAASADAGVAAADGTQVADAGGPTVGITDSEIRLGIAIIDVGQAEQMGVSFDLGNQQARWDALLKSVNDAGGIHGRQLVADYRTIEVVNAPVETAQAACVGWVEDTKVFAALVSSQLPAAALVCLTGAGATPTFTSEGFDSAYYGSTLLYTMDANDNRMLRDHARYLEEKGKLAGKTIGILTGEGAERTAVDNTLVPTLQDMGYQVARIESVPATTAATQRMPIAVSNFKAAGVDLVIMASNIVLAGPFVQAADQSNYRPEFAISDFNGQINDQMASYYPDSFEGTVALSTQRFPEYRAGAALAPADQACIDRVQPVDPKVLPTTNSAFEVAMFECGLFDMLVAGLTNAGQQLTQPGFIAGLEQRGPFDMAGSLGASFGPGKHDAGDEEREVAWRAGCGCWQLVGGLDTPKRRIE